MSSRIKFEFEKGGELIAEMLQDHAPKSIDVIGNNIPIKATVFHTRWCGREINFPVQFSGLIPRENQTSSVNTGDVIFWQEWDSENPSQALAIYYGAEFIRYHTGPLQVNVFARISQNQWPLIEEIGIRVWQQGIEAVEIGIL